MRRALLPGLLLCLPLALGAAEGPAPAPSPQDIAKAVAELASADFELRDAAYNRLLEWGIDHADAVLGAIPRDDADPDRRTACESLRKLVPRERLRRGALAAAKDDPALREAVEALFAAPSKATLASVATAVGDRPERALEALAAFLHHEDVNLRVAAMHLMRHGKIPGAAPLLVPLLLDPDQSTHVSARDAIASLDDRSVLPALEAMLDRPEPHARMMALQTMATLSPRGAPSARIVGFMADDDPRVRQAAAYAVLHRKDPASLAPVTALLSSPKWFARANAARVLSKHPGADPKPIVALLADAEPEVRLAAVESLRQMRHREAGPAVGKLLADPDDAVRAAAAGTAGYLGEGARVADLAPLLKDPVPGVRAGALQSLGMLKAAPFAKNAAALLSDPDFEVRRAAAGALCQMGAETYAEDVAKLLGDDKAEVVATAIAAVTELFEGPEAVRRIAPLLEHADDMVKVVATQVIGTLTGNRWDNTAEGSVKAHAWWQNHKNDPEYAPKRKPLR